MKNTPSIEVLEDRIAPATLTGQVLTYTDIDGDHVTVTVSKGALLPGNFTFNVANAFSAGNANTPMQLQLIDIHSDTGVAGANLTVNVTKAAAGDGLAAIGEIDATGVDLAKVKVAGDLGAIEAGSGGTGNVAIKSLSVRSMGLYGAAAQASANSTSSIAGQLSSMKVVGNVNAVGIDVNDAGRPANSAIGTITIGGSLDSSEIVSHGGGIRAVVIRGSMEGNAGGCSIIENAGPIGSVKVGGSIFDSAEIVAGGGAITAVTVGGSLYNGGEILSSAGTIGSVTITGSVYQNGVISSSGDMGTVQIGGSLANGTVTITGAGNLQSLSVAHGINNSSGAIGTVSGNITAINVGGTFSAGAISSGGTIGVASMHGSLGGTLGSKLGTGKVVVGGDLLGSGSISVSAGALGVVNVTGGFYGGINVSSYILSVTAGGDFVGGTLAASGNIGAVKFGGLMENASIVTPGTLGALTIGGSLESTAGVSASAGIASVVVKGSFFSKIQTSIAGANIGPVTIGGDADGTITSAGMLGALKIGGSLFSSGITTAGNIASITVGGDVLGTTILAGLSAGANVTIGAVKVGGNWEASNLSAGVQGSGGHYGQTGDTQIADSAKIASIAIAGIVTGQSSGHTGFDSQSIGSFTYDNIHVTLPASGNVNLDPLHNTVGIELV